MGEMHSHWFQIGLEGEAMPRACFLCSWLVGVCQQRTVKADMVADFTSGYGSEKFGSSCIELSLDFLGGVWMAEEIKLHTALLKSHMFPTTTTSLPSNITAASAPVIESDKIGNKVGRCSPLPCYRLLPRKILLLSQHS